jgi:hypothetical protein
MGCALSGATVAASPADLILESPKNNLQKKSPAQTYQVEKDEETVHTNKKFAGVFVGCLLIRYAYILSIRFVDDLRDFVP